jgi:hypothetical protein
MEENDNAHASRTSLSCTLMDRLNSILCYIREVPFMRTFARYAIDDDDDDDKKRKKIKMDRRLSHGCSVNHQHSS